MKTVVGVSLNRMGDGVAVRGSEAQGPQDQHVDGALEELDALFVVTRGLRDGYSIT